MNRLVFAMLPLLLTCRASAELADKTRSWMKDHAIPVPDGLSPHMQFGLDWLVANDCAAGSSSVATVPMTCVGDKAKDITEFLKVAPDFEPAKYLSAKSLAWLKDHKTVMPLPTYPNQFKGLNWLLTHDYKPGKLTIGGIELDATADKVADANEYLNLVSLVNFSNANGPAPRATNRVAGAEPSKILSAAAQAWVKDHKIVMPSPITAPQLEGLEWLITHDAKPGKLTVGGLPFEPTGDKSADVDRYLNDVAIVNF